MTNKEIAKMLDISPAALSLIINNKPGVSDATRTRVLQSLRDMNMEHLIKKTPTVQSPAHNIGFIIYKRNGEILDLHPFFLLLMENIERRAREYGYNILLNTIDRRMAIDSQIANLKELSVDGIIIFATEMEDDDIIYFNHIDIPTIAMDNAFPRLEKNTIAINNEMGTYQAVEHLVQMGHQRIGYLKSSMEIPSFEERHRGYVSAMSHFGITLQSEDIITIPYTEDGSYWALKGYLDQADSGVLPGAFVCDDDTMASGAIRAFTEAGLRVPEDISIVGFNDRPLCRSSIPPLTSINVSNNVLAEEAVDELIRIIRAENDTALPVSKKIRIGTRLVRRESVAKVKFTVKGDFDADNREIADMLMGLTNS